MGAIAGVVVALLVAVAAILIIVRRRRRRRQSAQPAVENAKEADAEQLAVAYEGSAPEPPPVLKALHSGLVPADSVAKQGAPISTDTATVTTTTSTSENTGAYSMFRYVVYNLEQHTKHVMQYLLCVFQQPFRVRNESKVSTASLTSSFDKIKAPATHSTYVADVLPPDTVAQYKKEMLMVDEAQLVLPDPPRVLGKGGFGEVCVCKVQWLIGKEKKNALQQTTGVCGTAGYTMGGCQGYEEWDSGCHQGNGGPYGKCAQRGTDIPIVTFSLHVCRAHTHIHPQVKMLQKCYHENLVQCVGITNAWPFKVLYELCEGGDLFNRLVDVDSDAQWSSRYVGHSSVG